MRRISACTSRNMMTRYVRADTLRAPRPALHPSHMAARLASSLSSDSSAPRANPSATLSKWPIVRSSELPQRTHLPWSRSSICGSRATWIAANAIGRSGGELENGASFDSLFRRARSRACLYAVGGFFGLFIGYLDRMVSIRSRSGYTLRSAGAPARLERHFATSVSWRAVRFSALCIAWRNAALSSTPITSARVVTEAIARMWAPSNQAAAASGSMSFASRASRYATYRSSGPMTCSYVVSSREK